MFLFIVFDRMLRLNKIKKRKEVFLVEVQNEKAEVRDEWLDEETIKFIDSNFFLRQTNQEVNERDEALAAQEVDEFVPPNNLICGECGKKFTRTDNLKIHIQKQHTARTEEYRCPCCLFVTTYRQNWPQHMARKHLWTLKDARKRIKEARKDLSERQSRENDGSLDQSANGDASNDIDDRM